MSDPLATEIELLTLALSNLEVTIADRRNSVKNAATPGEKESHSRILNEYLQQKTDGAKNLESLKTKLPKS